MPRIVALSACLRGRFGDTTVRRSDVVTARTSLCEIFGGTVSCRAALANWKKAFALSVWWAIWSPVLSSIALVANRLSKLCGHISTTTGCECCRKIWHSVGKVLKEDLSVNNSKRRMLHVMSALVLNNIRLYKSLANLLKSGYLGPFVYCSWWAPHCIRLGNFMFKWKWCRTSIIDKAYEWSFLSRRSLVGGRLSYICYFLNIAYAYLDKVYKLVGLPYQRLHADTL